MTNQLENQMVTNCHQLNLSLREHMYYLTQFQNSILNHAFSAEENKNIRDNAVNYDKVCTYMANRFSDWCSVVTDKEMLTLYLGQFVRPARSAILVMIGGQS